MLLKMASGAFLCCVVATLLGQAITGVQATNGRMAANLAAPQTWLYGAILTLPMFGLLVLERKSRWRWLRELWDLSGDILGPLVVRVTFAELVVVAAMAGVGEELFFRGFLQSWLASHELLAALILPNVLFGILHWISRGYAVCTFCIGLYFSCLLYFVTSVNLATLMVTHSLYDLVALMCLVREVRRRNADNSNVDW